MRQEPEVDERRLITIPFFVFRAGRRVSHHCHFKPLLEEVPQMGFDAEISRRAGENHLFDTSFPQLKHEIVGSGPIHFVRTCDDRVARLKIRFETLRPVGARIGEPCQRERAFSSDHTQLSHQHFERSRGRYPLSIRRVVVMRGEDHWIPAILRRSQ